jgi:hypothetical protein
MPKAFCDTSLLAGGVATRAGWELPSARAVVSVLADCNGAESASGGRPVVAQPVAAQAVAKQARIPGQNRTQYFLVSRGGNLANRRGIGHFRLRIPLGINEKRGCKGGRKKRDKCFRNRLKFLPATYRRRNALTKPNAWKSQLPRVR